MGLRERAAEHGEILGEYEQCAAVDGAPSGDDAVPGDLRLLHAEFIAAVLDEHVELLERVAVEEERDALPRGELAALVLGFDARFSAAQARMAAAVLELCEDVLHRAPCGRPVGANEGLHSRRAEALQSQWKSPH